jgi:hypothetical protein
VTEKILPVIKDTSSFTKRCKAKDWPRIKLYESRRESKYGFIGFGVNSRMDF